VSQEAHKEEQEAFAVSTADGEAHVEMVPLQEVHLHKDSERRLDTE